MQCNVSRLLMMVRQPTESSLLYALSQSLHMQPSSGTFCVYAHREAAQQAAVGSATEAAGEATGAAAAGAPATAQQAAATSGAAPVRAGKAGRSAARALIAPIIETMRQAGLQDDVPFVPAPGSPLASRAAQPEPEATAPTAAASKAPHKQGTAAPPPGSPLIRASKPPGAVELTPEDAEVVGEGEWGEYVARVYTYLQVMALVAWHGCGSAGAYILLTASLMLQARGKGLLS